MPEPDPFQPIYDRARHALTGDRSEGPENSELEYDVQDVVDELIVAEPGLADEDGEIALSGADLRAFHAWAGLETAARYILSPRGKTLAARLTQRKVAGVTRTYSNPEPQALADEYRTEAAAARLRIGFIRKRTSDANQAAAGRGSGGFALPGRRREIGQPRTIEGLAFGVGRREVGDGLL